jgi:prophage regulatory protein
MSIENPEAGTRLLRLPQVMHLTGLGRSQIYALAQAGKFPKPIKISERCSAWPESRLLTWIADRIAEAEHSKKPGAAP